MLKDGDLSSVKYFFIDHIILCIFFKYKFVLWQEYPIGAYFVELRLYIH